MIRIRYQDRTYILWPEDNDSRPVKFAPKDAASWVVALSANGLTIEVLAGGAKT